VAASTTVDADYFRRIDALNFAMAHDDGQLPQDLTRADTKTSCWHLAHLQDATSISSRPSAATDGNLPLVPGIEPPQALAEPHRAFVSAWSRAPTAFAETAANRVQMLADRNLNEYVDRTRIANELTYSRRLCARHGWPSYDVTRRSLEETPRPSSACCTTATGGQHGERRRRAWLS